MVATCLSENPSDLHSSSFNSLGLNADNCVFVAERFSASKLSVKLIGESSGVFLALKKYKPETKKRPDVAKPKK